jgi:hypothetical protein
MPGCAYDCTCGGAAQWKCEYKCPTPGCIPGSGLYGLDVADSGIGNTGATLAGCYSCLEKACGTTFMICDTDCVCEKGVLGFLSCAEGGTSILSCGTTLESTGGPNGAALVQCAAADCAAECGLTSVGIADAGVTD